MPTLKSEEKHTKITLEVQTALALYC